MYTEVQMFKYPKAARAKYRVYVRSSRNMRGIDKDRFNLKNARTDGLFSSWQGYFVSYWKCL